MGSTAVAPGSRSAWTARFWPRPRPWAVALAVLIAVVAAEVVVRALDARRGYSPRARTAWYWLFEQDPFLGYRGRPGASAWIDPPGLPLNADRVRHNTDGFRDRRRLADVVPSPSRRLVMCVGDANTYGLTAGSEEHTYPAVLEKELRALSGDESWTVFNAGLPGYTSHEVLELTKLRLLRLKPDVIVHMGLQYEHEQIVIFLDDRLDYTFYPLRMAPLAASPLNDTLMRSALVGRLAQRWRDRYVDDRGGRFPTRAYGEATERGTKLYFDNLALLAQLCQRSGVQLMLVDQPIHYSSCSYGPTLIESVERMRTGLRRLGAEARVPLLEAHEGFDWDGVEVRGDLLLASNESVLGREGYARLARRLAPQILKAYAAARSSEAPARPGG